MSAAAELADDAPAPFGLPITCATCGEDVELVQSVAHFGTRSVAVVKCRVCPRWWSIEILLRPLRDPK